ncbi:RNA 2',3'-cyclic phosphodiesterase [Paralimibaculum aggregatum]|uniref:RNA 2',3'-cyclic phosphodiesterase n=1 Tax=Paralimibaculum aggregatum TaxID=3036245 RepID=A0ABQ6LRK4_9RHOB|nr:RNA 2',3'-cyclic phosphodiesterase [Limibaculum sp. NKW23]GMG83886.1 RNA 2',3'-cyclic phosphodiesterase [Limibaculum sp. NKW23]
MIRAFVGIALPDAVAARLERVQAGLPAGRPVGAGTLHVTLAFLGEQPGPVLEDLHHGLAAIRAPALALEIDGLGIFGGARPRVLYAAIRPNGALSRLRERVLTAARMTGIEMPRERYVPHVTLARFSRPPGPEAQAALEGFVGSRAALVSPPFEIAEFVLFRSHLTANGAAYEALAEYPLG